MLLPYATDFKLALRPIRVIMLSCGTVKLLDLVFDAATAVFMELLLRVPPELQADNDDAIHNNKTNDFFLLS